MQNNVPQEELHRKEFPISEIGVQKSERDLFLEFKTLRKVKKDGSCDLISIKADYIKTPDGKQLLIASAAPSKNNQGEFWRVILEQKISKIIMICQEGENQCPQYWPNVNEEVYFEQNGIRIQNVSEEFLLKGDKQVYKRILKVYDGNCEIEVSHVFWPGWVDLGVPNQSSYYIIIQLVKQALASIEGGQKCLIHCKMGVGRTGTLICIINCILQMKKQLLDQKLQTIKQLNVSIYQTLFELRQQRTGSVELDGQYHYIYDFLEKIYQHKEFIN